jgi:hypothetical protein
VKTRVRLRNTPQWMQNQCYGGGVTIDLFVTEREIKTMNNAHTNYLLPREVYTYRKWQNM